MDMQRDVVVVSGVRTAIGDFGGGLKDVAPSPELRKWYGHEAERYEEFRRRYLEELQGSVAAQALEQLRELGRRGTVTIIVAARDAGHSSGAILIDLLQK